MGLSDFCGSVCRGIASGISSVGSAISSALGGVGGFIGSLAGKAASFFSAAASVVAGPLGPVLGPIVAQIIIKVVIKVVVAVATKLGIIKDKDEMREDGYRIEEAKKNDQLKKREDFATTEEYLAYLREQIPSEKIDHEKLWQEKDKYEFIGAEACMKCWEEKVNMEIPSDFMFEIGRCNLNLKEVDAIVAAFKAIGHDKVDFHPYLQGNMSGVMMEKLTDALVAEFKKVYPEKTENQIWDRIEECKKYSRDDKSLAELYDDRIENVKKQIKDGKEAKNIDFEGE
ncbi:MAG: hypothetical protein MJ048_00570 [Acidaminococcaceae bacterium]|nr:hypothetical protein [Acidaminococcaceae bacterium]